MNARQVRLLTVAALPLVTGGWFATASAEGPQYTYFDAGYQWVDTNNAVRMDGGQHEGIKLNRFARTGRVRRGRPAPVW